MNREDEHRLHRLHISNCFFMRHEINPQIPLLGVLKNLYSLHKLKNLALQRGFFLIVFFIPIQALLFAQYHLDDGQAE